MAERYEVATVDELSEDGSRILTEIKGLEIAVFRFDGEYYAVANFCVHQSGPLCEGPLEGNYTMDDDQWGWNYDDAEKNITCPWHGWMFDITNGENIKDSRYKVPTYDVVVEDGTIYVVR